MLQPIRFLTEQFSTSWATFITFLPKPILPTFGWAKAATTQPAAFFKDHYAGLILLVIAHVSFSFPQGCGYPPTTECDSFFKNFSTVGSSFTCYPSRYGGSDVNFMQSFFLIKSILQNPSGDRRVSSGPRQSPARHVLLPCHSCPMHTAVHHLLSHRKVCRENEETQRGEPEVF